MTTTSSVFFEAPGGPDVVKIVERPVVTPDPMQCASGTMPAV